MPELCIGLVRAPGCLGRRHLPAVALAEIGDKSQLVCMTLAARHRGLPVVIGAIAAFAILNLLAVLFGAAVAAWLPEWLVTLAVAVLFAGSASAPCATRKTKNDEDVEEKPGTRDRRDHLPADLPGRIRRQDATRRRRPRQHQRTLRRVGRRHAGPGHTSILGVFAGRKLLNRLPLKWIHRISGVFFLLLAVFALSRLL
jgi:putative Ca2+/H+ antiporter (TMEM165/GDT1 family)